MLAEVTEQVSLNAPTEVLLCFATCRPVPEATPEDQPPPPSPAPGEGGGGGHVWVQMISQNMR